MLSRLRTFAVATLLVSNAGVSDASAQVSPWAAVAVHYDQHRFPDEEPPTRLDGSAIGLTVLGGAALWRVPLRVEWSQGTIDDGRVVHVDVAGSTLTVTSHLEHRNRTFGLLTGYTHSVSSRVRLSFLLGAAYSSVRRTFRTNAPRVVLVSPSSSSATGVAVATDRFSTVTGGADVSMRLADQLLVTAGARLLPLRVLELDGSSLKSFVGLGWAF